MRLIIGGGLYAIAPWLGSSLYGMLAHPAISAASVKL